MDLSKLSCFQHVQWDPPRKELRKFARAMLVGFGFIGVLIAWRAHSVGTPTFVFWSIGVALAAAAFVPGLGRVAYLMVYVPSGIMGFIISRVLLTVVFFLLFTPLAFLLRLVGKDVLHLRRNIDGTEWISHPAGHDRKSFYRQF
jgi:hypothetical protein